MKSYEYCPKCRRRTEHIKDKEEMLCKRCGRFYKKKFNPLSFLVG